MPNQGSYFSSLIVSPTEYIYYLNGTSEGTQAPDWGYGADFLIGRDEAGNYLNGEVAEVIVYNCALNDSLRNLVETYLHDKYAPAVNLGADIVKTNVCSTKLQAHKNWFTNYQWNTGATTDSIVISSSGIYSVIVTDIFGFTSFDTIHVTYPGNYAPFLDTTICYGKSIKWDTQLNKTDYSFLWQDSSTDSVLTITQSGQYSVTVTDAFSCTRVSNTATVSVDTFPQVVSLGFDISMCSGGSIALVSGAGQTTDYLWSTGATTSSIAITTTGISTYTVTVTDANACTAQDTINVNVRGVAPIVDFTAPASCLGSATSFTDGTMVPSPDSIATWNWTFGDGNTSALPNPSHTYSLSGTYNAILTVVSDSGCSEVMQHTVNINVIPVPGFTALHPRCKGDSVFFNNTSNISSGSINAWNWDFGDSASGNNTSMQQNPVHTFSAPGGYYVKLMVVSNQGCKDSIQNNLNVFSNPICSLPSDISCLRLWLSSDSGITVDGSNNVMQWNDISGNNNNFIQATPANRPAY
ncbi:MAG: PKD domain-containing protein, partial [Bacteroidetes bacterium]|nr:PKD domain-containing protein [Bacteroidota bacterium]